MFCGVKGLLDSLRCDSNTVPKVGKLLTTYAAQHPGSKNAKTGLLWERMPCCLIKIYQCFGGTGGTGGRGGGGPGGTTILWS